MANKELDQMRSLLSNIYSEAESKPQPSKTLNSGTAKIDGANPTSPSTNPATRREEYSNYIKTLNKDQQKSLYNEVLWYKNQGMSNDQIYEKVLSNRVTTPDLKTSQPGGVDLTIKGNFDVYNPVDWQNQPEVMQQYYVQANNDIKESRRTLSQLMLQQDALESKSSNVNQVTTLIDAIENAYDRGVFDAETIAKTLGVDVNTVKLIQQGKANELVKLDQEYVQDQLKSYYRAEEDYDINLQRTMEDYNLAKTNLDNQYNSAMQTLRRNLFDEKRAASVGSAVAGISWSEYAINVIEAKHQQNMDDLEANYLYSSINQKYSYTRAIQDYNKNIQRLSEDFDDSLKAIQAGVLQQFQEIDNKIGLTTAQLAKAYGTLQQNVITAKADATTKYMEALSNNENMLANALANTYWLDTGAIWQPNMRTERNNNPTAMTTDVAKTLWMVEWVDYIVWDKFPNSNLHTARLLWDPIETTIRAFDNAAAKGIWIFYTQWWKQRWSHTAMTNEQWKKLTDEQKRNVIYAMLQREWGNMNNMSYYYEQWSTPWGVNDKERDFSWLSATQIAQIKSFVKEQLWATNAKTDVEMHNAVADMMRQWMDIDEIADSIRTSNKWLTLESDDLKNVKFVADKLITKKGLSNDKVRQEFYDQIQDYVKNGEYDLLLDSLNSSLYDAMSTTNKDTKDAAESLNNYLDEIEVMLQNIYDGGKSTGISEAYWEKAKNMFWKTSDPEYAEMQNYIDAVVQIYRKKITGAAFTESERKEYQKEFPSLFKDDTYNKSVIESLRKKNDTDIASAYGSVLWGKARYDALVKEISDLKTWWTTQEWNGFWTKWTYEPTRILTSITNPSAQAANNVFSNPWRSAPMSTATNSALTWVYQTVMPK